MGLQGGDINSFELFGGAHPNSNLMAGWGSLSGLDLGEVKNQLWDLGEPPSSLNVDELLMNVWTFGVNNQAMQVVDYEPAFDRPEPDSSLNPQFSLGLTRDLNNSVDELWQEIQQGQSSLDRKDSLGDMTLEDFLIKAGVVTESSALKINPGSIHHIVDPAQQEQSLQPVFMPGHLNRQPIPTGGSPVMNAVYSEMELVMSPLNLMATMLGTQSRRRRRVPLGVIEKIGERRLKRMIKNRESAARSRARKKAYQHELENEVSRLEEENRRLRQREEVDLKLPKEPLTEPRYQLCRTRSAPV
ncbi:ABSCISIC ACID-INSENSITIVE 5 2 [Olea europaea subsp. europaea]|uniref:ABSCISIC ACID-INSENSITIVE 5 2 n=1 Tax=Olea europaea subsp. europaea TaxID=158383 RepID=A0A8S0R7K7_OLEEU|nr:ABSCISIC ACID-INSENSITIVE 5 2 [Olea europaea subsp. europaea]